MLTHRRTASRDQQVRSRGSGSQTHQRVPVVLGDSEVEGLPAAGTHESLKRQAVGAYDLIGAEWLAGHDHLVARGENGYPRPRSEEHTSELQSRGHLVCRLLL